MLENLKPQAPDALLVLMEDFRADTRQGKIDLGVGVYKDASGHTPVMRAVREAETRILDDETTKTYTSLIGEADFRNAMAALILGEDYPQDRLASLATVAGTGAVRMGLELARLGNPDLRVFMPDPTWPNHHTLVQAVNLPSQGYRYFDQTTREVDIDGMLADLAKARKDDLVLLHGCCHNPTGANPTAEQWEAIADILEKTGAVPLVDLAYQGFGDGLDEDAAPTRMLVKRLPQVLIAASCSKNFGIYRERAGVLLALTPDQATRDLAQGVMGALNRQTHSFPPDRGARIVSMVLNDPALRADWEAELSDIRKQLLSLRAQLAEELRNLTGSDRFDFIARHRGMFSRLGASPEQVQRLRDEAAIYMAGDSRLNIAGLNVDSVPILARAIIEVGV